MSEFSPHLNVLPEGQRRLWGELSAVPREFTLYGGTALASGTKASVLQVRAEAKDYIDMDALIQIGKVGLPFALAAAEKLYGSSFNPEITLKALSYFDDGNPRKSANRSSTAATRFPLIDVSTSIARHSRL